MRKVHSKWFGIAWLCFVLICLTGMFSASFFLTAFLYQITNFTPPALVVQIVNSVLGLLLFALIAGTISKVANSRGWIPEMNLFGPIIEALEKIAKGDFRVRLKNDSQDNQMVSLLTNSINKMALELEQMETMRQEFISNVSHEIQSPLTSIRGFSEALRNDDLSLADRHHYLSIIEAESTRLSRITADLLRLAALESEHSKFEPKPYRLDKQIRSVILACEPQWLDKKLEMNITLEPIEINADEDLLSQVWMNLIYNSIKFTPAGGQICISLAQDKDTVKFKIQDSGNGIALKDQSRIFERFYKVDKSRTKSNGGSGLGLAISKKIVEMHAGQIDVESTPGAGAVFTVRLKLFRSSV
jgi:two-component system, OmpR family, phosphate regulon sensor histidine kinase PhoR